MQYFAAMLGTLSLLVWAWAAARVSRGEPLVAYVPRRPVPWQGADLLAIAVFFAAAIGLFATAFSSAIGDGRGPIKDEVAMAAGASANALTIGFALIWLVRRTGAEASDLGWRRETLGRDVRIGLVAFAALSAPVYALQLFLSQFSSQQHPIIEALGKDPSGWLYGLAGLSVVVVAPLAEEFFFRGLLQGWLEARGWRHGAIVFTSLFFAVMHWGHGMAPVPLFFFSLGLGWLYQRTHRLLPSIVVHCCLNACSLALLPLAHVDRAA